MSGAVASVGGWVLYVLNIQSVPIWPFQVVGAILILAAMVRAFHDIRVERDVLLESRKPKCEIIFAPDSGRPYLQVLDFRQSTMEMRDRRYRVGVHSLSDVTITVSLRLASCALVPDSEPVVLNHLNFVFPEHELAVQDTDPTSASCEIPPHETRWFDVVNEIGPASSIPDHFRVCYRNPNFSAAPVPFGTYEMVLRVDGSNAPSVSRRFRVTKLCHTPQTYERLTLEAL